MTPTPNPVLELVGSLAQRNAWTRAEVEEHQRAALRSIVEHAVTHSPYYRDALGADAADRPLDELPVLTKSTLMANYDDVVTDPRLRLDAIDRHLAGPTPHEPFADEFELFTTSGTTGARGVFAYTREELRVALATTLRGMMRLGARPGMRLVGIGSPSPMFMSRRIFAGMQAGADVPPPDLSVTTPMDETVRALQEFRPEALFGYPSHIALLAVEQLEGRLDISPSVVATGSEVLTADHIARIEAAWGVRPGNGYVTTEACPIAIGSSDGVGLHVADDMVIIEVVDEHGSEVAPGTPGHRLLLTNLANRTQPLIRYEITDSVTLLDGPNPTGLPWSRIAEVDGRTAEILTLPGSAGTVRVHPHQLRGPIASFPAVHQYQFAVDGERIDVALVLGSGAPPDTAERVRRAIAAELDTVGVVGVEVGTRVVDRIEREPGGAGKLKQIRVAPAPLPA